MIGLGRIPIRWRLSLWYMTLTALVLVIFSVAVYIGLERRLSENLDDDLRSQASLAAASITASGDSAVLDPTFRKQLSDEVLLWVLNFNGNLVLPVRGEQLGTIPVRKASISRASYGLTTYDTIHAGGQHLRTITVPVRNDAGIPAYALQLGYSTSRIEDALELLIQALLVIAPLAIIVAALTGYLLAGRALQPVADITRLASQIDGEDLESRLNLDLPNDELGRLARTFDLMLDRIDLAFQRQRQFTGDAAHELRTPIAFMRSQVDLALHRPRTADDYQEALQEIDLDLERLTGLVNSLLTLARSDAGKLPVERAQIDLAELVGMIVEQFTPIAIDASITLVNDATMTLVSIDSDLIVQLLVNLVDNAIAHSPCGGTVSVGCRVENMGARIWVEDSGPGIPAEDRERVFDRFYRVDTGRDRSRGGAGLGLSICRAIVEAHGGTIEVGESDLGGARFDVLLPTP